MKKTLLNAPSNLNLFKKDLLSQILLFAFVLGLGFTQTGVAQNCITPYYKAFESFSAAAVGFTYTGTLGVFAPTVGTGNANSGTYFLQHVATNNDAQVVTPNYTTVSTFSFYIKKTGTAGTYSIEFWDGAAYQIIPAGTNTISGYTITSSQPAFGAAYQQVTVSFAVGTPIATTRFRISDVRTTGTTGNVFLDDFAWTSTLSAENTIVVSPRLGTSACNAITVPAAGTGVLTYYDQGGLSDTYSKSQNQIWQFAPAVATEKVKITFQNSFALNSGLAGVVSTISVFNGSGTGAPFYLNAYTSTSALPPITVYTSTDNSGYITVQFISGTGVPLSGFDIKVECVGCAAPTGLAFAASGGVSNNSAYLTWSGSASNYDIYYNTTGAVPNGLTVPSATSATTSATISPLSSSTLYNFWVRSNCGLLQSTWSGPISATTLCTPQTVTYLENFNGYVGGVLPTCTSASNPSWQTNPINGNLFGNAETTSFFTQGVTLTAGQLYRITYDYGSNGSGTADLILEIGHPTNNVAPTQANISSFLAAQSSIGNTTLISNIVNYNAPVTGTYYLEFNLDALSIPASGALDIDNIKIEIETCLPPTVPTASGINDFGATVSWVTPTTGNPTNGYYYFVSTTNTPPNYSDTATGTTAFMQNSVTLSTLSPNTQYYVWVRSNCGGQISAWSTQYASFLTTNVSAPVNVKIDDATSPFTVACGAPQVITFTDTNISGGNYANNEKTGSPTFLPYSYTFRPSTPTGKLKVVFNSFQTENNYDGLMIYSGQTSGGILMSSGRVAGFNTATCPAGAYSGTGSPGTILSTAADGSLTFEFRSDYSIVYSGWTATITCVPNPPSITSFTPTNNSCGAATNVVITGINFTTVSNVSFNGTSAAYTVNSPTQITATVPAGATTGTISVTTSQATGTSTTNFTMQSAPPSSTGVSICPNGSGNLTSSASCDIAGLTSFTGSLTASSPLAPKLSFSGTTCSFFGGPNYYYNSTQITVSVTGSYTFQTTSVGNVDLMAYITSGPFTAGSCATGVFIRGDDDAAGFLQPSITVTLTAGTVYTLFTTTYNSFVTANYTWNITPPVGGSIALYQAGQVQWYTAASGGSPIGTGSPFNPVGVAGSGLADTSTAGTTIYYAACSSNPTCRTATNFVINPSAPGTASSNQSVCSGVASALTLVGNSGSVTKWQYSPNASFLPAGSVVDIPSSASNTLTSLQIGSFSGTRYFRAEVNTGFCGIVYSNVITITFTKTIWNGSVWSNGQPNSTTGAEFQGNFISSVNTPAFDGNLSACSVLVTSGTVLFDIGTLTVQNEVTVNSGSLTVEDNASLYQVQAVANAAGVYSGGNSGNISSRRVAEPMYKFDYTYWSTPVNPQNLLAVSPGSPTGLFLSFNSATGFWQYLASPSTTTMTVGKGYAIRAPLTYPVSPTAPLAYTATFTGVPNNGTFTVPIIGGASQMNLIGNPYPSALYAVDFINGNANVNGTLYFWTHNTSLNPVTLQYNASDYAMYNLVGGTLPAPTSGAGTSNLTAPLGYIASGQGFFVKGLTSGTATFSNSMRRAGNNTQFYRPSSNHATTTLEKHRYWLDISNTQGAFKEVLIGYIETATSGIDRMFDGELVDIGNTITLYTTVDNTKMSIQGRPLPFDVNETLPLGYKSTIDGTYTINLPLYDGLFATQHVYIEDKLLNVIHDLRESPYTFATVIGAFDDRFLLRYTTETLGTTNPIFNENSVIVYKNDQGLFINTGTETMRSVSIFDIRGRVLATQKQIENTSTVFTTLPTTQQVLMVRIEGENGAIVTKKVVF